MDWEGGTIGAIVPALMGHGEAGRASPWPFSFSQFPIVKPKKTAADAEHRRLSLFCFRVGSGLREQFFDDTPVTHQGDRTARAGVVFHGGIDPEVVVEACCNVIWRDSLVSRT